jgi:hypothetical protein
MHQGASVSFSIIFFLIKLTTIFSWFRKTPPTICTNRRPFPDDMVRLPPERRQLSVLPYIINQYTQTDSEEEYNNSYDEYFDDDHYNYEDDHQMNGYEVVIGQEIDAVGSKGKLSQLREML